MKNEADKNSLFHLYITISGMVFGKVTLFHRESTRNIELLRIDYTDGQHKNPPFANGVPPFLEAYGNAILKGNHIHIYVTGYGLSWAIPLDESDFPIKEIRRDNININFAEAVLCFSERIGLLNRIKVHCNTRLPFE